MSALLSLSNYELADIVKSRTDKLVDLVDAAVSSMDNQVDAAELDLAIAAVGDVLTAMRFGSSCLMNQLLKAEDAKAARFDSLVAATMVPVFEEPGQEFIDRFEKVEA